METFRRTVVENGEEYEVVLEPGEKVKCLRCGGIIEIGDSTVKEINGETYVVCLNRISPKNETLGSFRCGRIVPASHYAHIPGERREAGRREYECVTVEAGVRPRRERKKTE